MSNPKEKAEELCFKFQGDFDLNWTMSKRCAIIAVNEVLELIYGFDLERTYLYYQEVKNEIEKL